MKKHCICISYCTVFFVLILLIPLLHSDSCSRLSSPDTVILQGRTPRRLLSTYQSIPIEKSDQVVEEESWSLMHQEGSDRVESLRSSESEDTDESMYHLDYHGVKTHPSPTPKIPRP